jgi:hypothetical protein
MARHDAIRDIVRTVGSISRALLAHQGPNQELHDLAVELRLLEVEFVAGQLPIARLERALKVIAEFEYTPWRIPTVVEDLYNIWSLIGML